MNRVVILTAMSGNVDELDGLRDADMMQPQRLQRIAGNEHVLVFGRVKDGLYAGILAIYFDLS